MINNNFVIWLCDQKLSCSTWFMCYFFFSAFSSASSLGHFIFP